MAGLQVEVGGMSREGPDIYIKFMPLIQGGNRPCANRSRGPGTEPNRSLAVLSAPETDAGALESAPHQQRGRTARCAPRLAALEFANGDDTHAGRASEVRNRPVQEIARRAALGWGHRGK